MKKHKALSVQPDYVITAQQILDLGVLETPMLLAPILPKGKIAVLAGGSDTGKSYLTLYLAMAICGKAKKVIGWEIKKEHSTAIIVCTEDTKEDLSVRLNGLVKSITFEANNLRFILDSDKVVERLKEELSRKPADLIVIDTFGDVFAGNINDSIVVRDFFKPYKKLAAAYNCAILFNHHVGKASEGNNTPNKSHLLGSQAIESASRTVLFLKKDIGSKKILTALKGNSIPDDLKNKGIVLDFDVSTGFKRTGQTMKYSDGVSNSSNKKLTNEKDDVILAAYAIHKSYRKTAEALTKKGTPMTKYAVGQAVKRNKEKEQNDGQEESV